MRNRRAVAICLTFDEFAPTVEPAARELWSYYIANPDSARPSVEVGVDFSWFFGRADMEVRLH
jgi:hypothetical protein